MDFYSLEQDLLGNNNSELHRGLLSGRNGRRVGLRIQMKEDLK